jgi:hypothetical protein
MTRKIAISIRDEVYESAKRYALQDGLSLSAWLDRAAEREVRRRDYELYAKALDEAGYNSEEYLGRWRVEREAKKRRELEAGL